MNTKHRPAQLVARAEAARLRRLAIQAAEHAARMRAPVAAPHETSAIVHSIKFPGLEKPPRPARILATEEVLRRIAPDAPPCPGELEPACYASFAEYESARKAAQCAWNDYALHDWLRTLPAWERAARWEYTLDTRAWLASDGVGAMPLLSHYGL
jgi:hypothetical protein